jgi:alcohol dehydrogenase
MTIQTARIAAPPALHIPPRPELLFGVGSVQEAGGLVRRLGHEAALVVTDRGVAAAGVAALVLDALNGALTGTALFDGVSANPSAAQVDAGRDALADLGPAAVVAVGGGSAIDAAKAIALGAKRGAIPPAPIVAVPTTAGSGAETNGFAVIDDPAGRCKRYVGDSTTMPRFAILDPELTLSAPSAVTAACGIDVLARAVESLQARSGNPYSAALALEAVHVVMTKLPGLVADAAEVEGRAALLMASHLAGLASAGTGLGTAQAIGHALSARYGVAHGAALAAVLPLVARMNLDERFHETGRIALAAGVAGGAAAVPEAIAQLEDHVRLHPRLSELGVPAGDLPAVADAALADEVVHNAPRVPAAAELVELLRAAY